MSKKSQSHVLGQVTADKKWKKFEVLVAKIKSDLSPDATIKVNHKIVGKISNISRQVDVFVQESMGNQLITMAIECKDYAKPLNVKHVESIIGHMRDIGVNVGVVVSAKGFSKGALNVGRHAGLKLYRLVDTGDHDWKSTIGIPAVCYVKNLDQFNFIIQYNLTRRMLIPIDHSMMLYDSQRRKIGEAQEILLDWWFGDHNQASIGFNERVDFIMQEVFLLIDNELVSIGIQANLKVDEIVYFRQWPVVVG